MQVKRGRSKESIRWHLYILECSDTSFYTGITNDLDQRVRQHNAGKASRYTRSRKPVRLVYQERCANRSEALKKEYALKQVSRKEKETYIASNNGKKKGVENTSRRAGSVKSRVK